MLLTENQLRRLIYLQVHEGVSIEEFLINEGIFDNQTVRNAIGSLAATAILITGFQHHLNNYIPYTTAKTQAYLNISKKATGIRDIENKIGKEEQLKNTLFQKLKSLNAELKSESEEELKEKLVDLVLQLNNNSIPHNVAKQVAVISSIRDEEDSKYPFIVVDDANRKLYLFEGNYIFKNLYPVITGGDKGDFDYFDFTSWLASNNVLDKYSEAKKKNDKKTLGNYFNYFLMQRRDTNSNITPSGIYTIGNVEEFTDQQKQDPAHVNNYGKVGKLSMRTGMKDSTLKREPTIAVHGTQKPKRIANLQKAKSQLEKNGAADIIETLRSQPSFGCINLLDEDLAKLIKDLNFTKDKANKIYIYIMSDETPDGVIEYGSFEKAIAGFDYIENFMSTNALKALSFLKIGTAIDFNNEKFLEFIGKKKN